MIAVPLLIAAVVYGPMIIEARRAANHERAQRARGGVEAAGDVYRVMAIAYPAAFLLMILEGVWRGPVTMPVFAVGLLLFVAAKALKWWAILSLGRFWTFRVIVIPGAPLVARGPYRLVRHPNYLGVAGELVSAAIMTGARVAGPLGTIAFCALMLRRVQIEGRALRAAESTFPDTGNSVEGSPGRR
jgi:methyltransferase